jgi:hypothetical protein
MFSIAHFPKSAAFQLCVKWHCALSLAIVSIRVDWEKWGQRLAGRWLQLECTWKIFRQYDFGGDSFGGCMFLGWRREKRLLQCSKMAVIDSTVFVRLPRFGLICCVLCVEWCCRWTRIATFHSEVNPGKNMASKAGVVLKDYTMFP